MWVSTHYACLVVAILLLESAALFAYTLIGLLKSNPLPWIYQPPMPQCAMYQSPSQNQQTLLGGPAGGVQQQDTLEGIHIITSTSVVYQTLGMSTTAPTASVAMDIAGIIKGGAAAGGLGPQTLTLNDGKITTITPPTPASTETSTTSSTSASSSSTTDNADKQGSDDHHDDAKDSTDTVSGPPTTLSGRDTTETSSFTRIKGINYVTSVTLLTSTLAPHKDDKPKSTSTTVVVVTPSPPPGRR